MNTYEGDFEFPERQYLDEAFDGFTFKHETHDGKEYYHASKSGMMIGGRSLFVLVRRLLNLKLDKISEE